jgi:hypothetical protein
MTEAVELPDRRAIACNYTEGTGVASEGAKAYVDTAYIGGNLPERVHLLARSRGGRWVKKWENMRRLDNFRFKTLPPEHPLYGNERIGNATDEDLARLLRAKEELR